ALSGVDFSGNGASCQKADAQGHYACTVPSGWSGTITPALNGYTFAPSYRSYDSVNANQGAQDYAATAAVLPTTTALTSTPNPASAGAAVTFMATITGTNPTGTVTFTEGAVALLGCSAVALTGVGNTKAASCSTASLGVGSHSVTARYSGDAGNAGSI